MRLFSTLAIVALAATPMAAIAQPAPPPAPPAAPSDKPAPAYSSGASTIGALLADPNAKAVVGKYLPEIVASDQISQAAGMTLKDIQQYLPNMDDKMLAAIDADLAKVPAPKK